jgi:hypothetical protein
MTTTWRTAETVADLGNLMAAWLTGEISTRPGYWGTGPDPETEPLVPHLAAVCQAGYVTTDSQPGEPPQLGRDGRVWEQRSAVSGWIADARLAAGICTRAREAGLLVVATGPGRRHDGSIPVTAASGRGGSEIITDFGWSPGHRRMIREVWSGVGGRARRALRHATILTVVDPMWGRDSLLWPVLGHAIAT